MDARLLAKVERIEKHAHACGWDTERHPQWVDGCEAIQLVGTTVRGNPEAPAPLGFGFTVAFAVNSDTHRVAALRLDGKANAVFVVTVDDDSGRYWYGPLSAHVRALDDPAGWTGVYPPEPISR